MSASLSVRQSANPSAHVRTNNQQKADVCSRRKRKSFQKTTVGRMPDAPVAGGVSQSRCIHVLEIGRLAYNSI
ncbi:hypothetical protein ANO14919_132170 [Xylariales sp. No.14919]|nr:hypothetical protein ANO14919_132170 [Xylariales sp. No.14919]